MTSLDTETTGLDRNHGARPFLVTVCDDRGRQEYWEWDVDPLTRKVRMDPTDVQAIRTLIFKGASDELILHNAAFDVSMLSAAGVISIEDWPWQATHDTTCSAHLLDSAMKKDLTNQVVNWLNEDIEPWENRLEAAVKDCRKHCRVDLPTWRIAEEGLPDMPSVESGSKKAEDKPWRNDTWLPRTLAKHLNYPEPEQDCQHTWVDWSCVKCGGHRWWVVLSEYANKDSSATVRLWYAHRKAIAGRGLWQIYKERIKLLPIVTRMNNRRIFMEEDRLETQYETMTKEADESHAKCLELADGQINNLPVNGVSNDLRKVVFEHFHLVPSRKTEKGNPSMDKYVLEDWLLTLPEGDPKEFIKGLKLYRKRKTALSFMESYRAFWLKTEYKKYRALYSSLNLVGTGTLRGSMSNPNLQQVAKQEEVSLRGLFGPGPGREWWPMDYENLELRIPAYESGEEIMIELFEKPDDPPFFGSYHLMNASIIYPDLFWPIADKKGEFKKLYGATWYQWLKNFDFADQYGAMLGSGTADRAAHKPGAQALVCAKLKKRTALSNRVLEFANKHGYVETIPDKTVDPHRGYPIVCSRSEWGDVSPTVPFSYHIQSTAMQCTNKAMVRCEEQLDKWRTRDRFDGWIALQVHDEIVFDFPKGGKRNLWRANRLKKLMEQSGDDIGIPLRVAVSYNPVAWGKEEEPT